MKQPPTTLHKTIGAMLSAHRKREGLTLYDLSDMSEEICGVRKYPSDLCAFENGTKAMSLRTLEQVLKLYNAELTIGAA